MPMSKARRDQTTNAALVAADDGAGGTKWNNVQAALNYIRASFATLAALVASGGAALIGFIDSGAGAVARTVQALLRERVSVKNYGVVGDGVTDDAAAILLAIASGRRVYFPAGTYLIRSSCVFTGLSNFALIGDGKGASVIKCHATDVFSNVALGFVTCGHFSISGLTIDQNNNASFTATHPAVMALSCTDFTIEKNEALRFTYIGIAADSCQRFSIQQNRVERDAAINTTNYAINVSSSASVSTEGGVLDNECQRSGAIVKGKRIRVRDNLFNATKYGAGLTTAGDGTATYGEYLIGDNICCNGSGTDVDGVDVAGMEIDGYYVKVISNNCYGNAGKGIAMLAFRSELKGNLCYGNGIAAGGGAKQAGIAMGYVNANHGAHYCDVAANTCFDIGGPTQLYGYYEESASLIGVKLGQNKLDGNGTADVFLQGGGGWYDTEWTAYTPTLTATGGALTTVGAVSGRWKRSGRLVHWKASCAITTNGTGSGKLQVTLPAACGNVANGPFVCYGRENGVTGKMLIGQFLNGTQNAQVAFYDDTYPGASGAEILVEGFYEVA